MAELKPSEYKRLAEEQGRKPAWMAKQLDCSYTTVYKFLNDIRPMSQDKIKKLHKILVG